jgi:hypothetical protein
MLILLALAWACTGWLDCVVEGEVEIHEWGVIEVDQACLELRGLPWGFIDDDGYLLPPPEPVIEAKAPVIWFHGDYVTGTFTVEILNSDFTELIPPTNSIEYETDPENPDIQLCRAVWEGLETHPALITSVDRQARLPSQRRLYGPDSFLRSVPLWRSVPCNGITYEQGSYTDLFLYYETELHDAEMFSGDYYGHMGEALLFFADFGDFACVRVDVPADITKVAEHLTESEILDEINSWAPYLFREEVSALWKTWEPLIRARCERDGETLLFFPLSDEKTWSVSRLDFTPDDSFIRVTYERLFIGLGEIPGMPPPLGFLSGIDGVEGGP